MKIQIFVANNGFVLKEVVEYKEERRWPEDARWVAALASDIPALIPQITAGPRKPNPNSGLQQAAGL